MENDRLSKTRRSPRVLIVCKEIESWYLAGLTDNDCKKMGIADSLNDTDHLSKEQFSGPYARKIWLQNGFHAGDLAGVRSRDSARQKQVLQILHAEL